MMLELKPFVRRIRAHVSDFINHPIQYARIALRDQTQTDLHRWSDNSNFQQEWDTRTIMIAQQVQADDFICEFGAGMQAIRTALPDGCRYQPFDLVARLPGTLVCDLNLEYPEIPTESNVAIFSGVLEYINDLKSLFEWLNSNFERVIFSYATTEHTPTPLERSGNGWVNAYAQTEIQKIAVEAGYNCTPLERWRNHVIFTAVRR